MKVADLTPLFVLAGTFVGAAAALLGQVVSERYKRHRDGQMTARGIAGSIEATLLLTDRRGYVPMFEAMIRRIEQGDKLVSEKLLEDASIDPITATILERVGLLGHDLPARVIAFMFVLSGIRVDLVRFGRGEFENNMPALANILRGDLALWEEYEPKARLLVRDLRNHANEPFRFWSMW